MEGVDRDCERADVAENDSVRGVGGAGHSNRVIALIELRARARREQRQSCGAARIAAASSHRGRPRITSTWLAWSSLGLTEPPSTALYLSPRQLCGWIERRNVSSMPSWSDT